MYLYSYVMSFEIINVFRDSHLFDYFCHVIDNFRYIISSKNQVFYTGYIFWSNGTPEKQLLVCLSYLASPTSMRETGHIYRVCLSCDTGEVENEFHFFSTCPHYISLRKTFSWTETIQNNRLMEWQWYLGLY
jgi:hypothetical protein